MGQLALLGPFSSFALPGLFRPHGPLRGQHRVIRSLFGAQIVANSPTEYDRRNDHRPRCFVRGSECWKAELSGCVSESLRGEKRIKSGVVGSNRGTFWLKGKLERRSAVRREQAGVVLTTCIGRLHHLHHHHHYHPSQARGLKEGEGAERRRTSSKGEQV